MNTHEVRFEIASDLYDEAAQYSKEFGLPLDVMAANAFAGYLEAVRLGHLTNEAERGSWASAIRGLENHIHFPTTDLNENDRVAPRENKEEPPSPQRSSNAASSSCS